MSEEIRDYEEATSDDELANEIAAALKENPHKHSIPELADGFEVSEGRIAYILTNYTPADDGDSAKFVGEGQGGGWIPEDVAVLYRQDTDAPPIEIGFRWPDGELRDEVFDLNNDDHLQILGLTRTE